MLTLIQELYALDGVFNHICFIVGAILSLALLSIFGSLTFFQSPKWVFQLLSYEHITVSLWGFFAAHYFCLSGQPIFLEQLAGGIVLSWFGGFQMFCSRFADAFDEPTESQYAAYPTKVLLEITSPWKRWTDALIEGTVYGIFTTFILLVITLISSYLICL